MKFDDKGESLAFGIIMAGVFLFGASIILSLLLTPFNIAFVPMFNGLLSNNIGITQQTADAFGFYRDAGVAAAILVLIAVLLWAWVRGSEARNEQR